LNSQVAYFWKTTLELMTGSVIMLEVDAAMQHVLSREKTSAFYEISWYQ